MSKKFDILGLQRGQVGRGDGAAAASRCHRALRRAHTHKILVGLRLRVSALVVVSRLVRAQRRVAFAAAPKEKIARY